MRPPGVRRRPRRSPLACCEAAAPKPRKLQSVPASAPASHPYKQRLWDTQVPAQAPGTPECRRDPRVPPLRTGNMPGRWAPHEPWRESGAFSCFQIEGDAATEGATVRYAKNPPRVRVTRRKRRGQARCKTRDLHQRVKLPRLPALGAEGAARGTSGRSTGCALRRRWRVSTRDGEASRRAGLPAQARTSAGRAWEPGA